MPLFLSTEHDPGDRGTPPKTQRAQPGLCPIAVRKADGPKQRQTNRSCRGLKLTLFLSAIISCSFLISGCENDEKMIEDWSKKKLMVEVGKDIESYLSQESKVKAKLTAPLMLRYESDTVVVEFPKSLHVDFYDDSTKIESWLDARHGKYFETLNKVYLWDSVVVINVKGDTLKSSDLWWDQNTKLFYTDRYAEYRTKDKQIFPSKGLEVTQDFKRITFKQPTGIVHVSDKEFPQ